MSKAEKSTVEPFSLRDAPALIERLFPAQKVSAEAQKERKAGAGQTLTALGSYWKGRKPLILVRACVLGALLPATDDEAKDLEIFEKLMAMDDDAFQHRAKRKSFWPEIVRRPYLERLNDSFRPEELSASALDAIWPEVNEHLGTCALDLPTLVEQLGIMRFGHRPRIADTFAGGGSIPFESARLGCDVYASDLNPIACMLNWGALKVIGADPGFRRELSATQAAVANAVDQQIQKMGIEVDADGNRAKVYLYCTEVLLDNGWRIPISQTWLISAKTNTIARLSPDPSNKRFNIAIENDVSDDDARRARIGTLQDGYVVYHLDGEEFRLSIKGIRGDRRGDYVTPNDLRRWESSEFHPRATDRYQERLYCIQWSRPDGDVFFRAPTERDLQQENNVQEFVAKRLASWQATGILPDMPIEPGDKTDEPIRTRGWTYWHHLFAPRQLLVLALYKVEIQKLASVQLAAAESILLASALNRGAKLCRLDVDNGVGRHPKLSDVFTNQALNTLFNFGVRSHSYLRNITEPDLPSFPLPDVEVTIETSSATQATAPADIFVTDPPYADAVHYHEITEFFIAWLRRNPPTPFAAWIWDSRRSLAVRGEGNSFRQSMVEAYRAMTMHMPDNGLQIVMFTHQSGEVWADMAQIFWGAGLQVMAAWYIATETSSELKKGGYVQGTVILVLRKRRSDESGYRDEIVQEVKAEVARQIDTMVGLNQSLKGRGRIENLFEDADLQMAGYAAALRVLTGYARIDGTDMTREALRPRKKGERTLVSDIIEFSVQVANEHLVPEGLDARVWDRLTGSERFYLKMIDIETTGATKLDNYQNFAKAFRVPDYTVMMGSLKPNAARLRSAAVFKKADFVGSEFATSPTRALLYACACQPPSVPKPRTPDHRDRCQL